MVYTYLILVALIIGGGIYKICKRFTIIDKVEIENFQKAMDEASVKMEEVIASNQQIEQVNLTMIAGLKKKNQQLEAAEFKLQELGTENVNLQEEIRFHKQINEKSADFVAEHFSNILHPNTVKRLQNYTKTDILNNVKSRVKSCVDGLRTIDFSRM